MDLDFEFDGRTLSSFGFIICSFDSSGVETPDSGSTIAFNKVSSGDGKKFFLTGTKYESCIQQTISICKNPDIYLGKEKYIKESEYNDIARWLNRHEFCKFRLLDYDDYNVRSCYFNASFNLKKVILNGDMIGIELTMETDSPFGYGDDVILNFDITDTSKLYDVFDSCDDTGYIYPSLYIKCNSDGDLEIENQTVPCKFIVKNCSKQETITVNGETLEIYSSLESHEINKDFNFRFLKIGNSYSSRLNKLKFSIPCTVRVTYTPNIKDTPF